MQVLVFATAFAALLTGTLGENATSSAVDPSSSSNNVGFSVRKAVSSNGYTVAASPFNLQFQEVLSNVGNGWKTASSEFIAPFAGTFFFTFNAVSTKTRDFTVALKKNGVYQVTAYGPAGYQWGGNSALLLLNKGDSVILNIQDGEIYEHPLYEAYTTFSGFLVFKS